MANDNNNKNEQNTLKGARSFVAIILIGVLCCYALMSNTKGGGQVLPMIFGKGCAVVMTGSMEPTIPVDAMIFVERANDYKVGDIVVIQEGYTLVVHRIVKIEGDMVTTKGDANNTEDEPVTMSHLRGRVTSHIPYVGNAINFMKTPLGSMMAILIAFLLYFAANRGEDDEEEEEVEEKIKEDGEAEGEDK